MTSVILSDFSRRFKKVVERGPFPAAQMTDLVIEALSQQWQQLGSLRLTNCASLSDASLRMMAALPALYTLFLSGNRSFSHGLMSMVKHHIKLATFRQCGDLSVCLYGSLLPPSS